MSPESITSCKKWAAKLKGNFDHSIKILVFKIKAKSALASPLISNSFNQNRNTMLIGFKAFLMNS